MEKKTTFQAVVVEVGGGGEKKNGKLGHWVSKMGSWFCVGCLVQDL